MNKEFSVRGPYQSFPWIAIVESERDGKTSRATTLLWAKNEEHARRFVNGHNKNATNIDLYPSDPNHHLGSNLVVLNITNC